MVEYMVMEIIKGNASFFEIPEGEFKEEVRALLISKGYEFITK